MTVPLHLNSTQQFEGGCSKLGLEDKNSMEDKLMCDAHISC